MLIEMLKEIENTSFIQQTKIQAVIRIAKINTVCLPTKSWMYSSTSCLLVEQNLNNVVLDVFLNKVIQIGSRLVVLEGMKFYRA